ncbi:uncharacterized protein LOC121503389 [Cheilinus undulatus]|uniref:uncharacterized protein LOC121503389 n=1 Tax=Cheilinus undulatus TaxID=241271 RepID=UPI001BD5725B|nr:uncharacterized protein LOC121503389 [Cheilinus undulatus]
MSIDGTKLLFEGFLQKRKDTMKMRWATYWFRLQNTTLFFYTKENCSASHLRGYYYIYTVQSVREVHREDSKRFMFEIIMTNGKRKMLAAETAALRQQWVSHLWQAMNLSASRVPSSRSSDDEVCEQRDRIYSIVPVSSQFESVMDSLPPRPLSAPSGHAHHKVRSIDLPVCRPVEPEEEEPTYQNIQSICSYQNETGESVDIQSSDGVRNAEKRPEGDYDVLPIRKKICESNDTTETKEVVYDVPVSHRRTDENPEPEESIYDVPSSLIRKASYHSSDEQLEDAAYWRI